MKILGIDPGIARVGWGLVEKKNQGEKFLECGLIETSKSLSEDKRLKQVYDKVCDIINKTDPEMVAVEKLYFFKNQKTAFQVSQARGVILLAASDNRKKIKHFTPLQIKQAVSGYGRADKKQVGQMVKAILNLKRVPKPDDVTDGLAVAICASSTCR
jgi:crossover junction endodeoxyribonuclease RuvC